MTTKAGYQHISISSPPVDIRVSGAGMEWTLTAVNGEPVEPIARDGRQIRVRSNTGTGENIVEPRYLPMHRAHLLGWICEHAGPDGWTTESASNPAWVVAGRSLAGQGVLQMRMVDLSPYGHGRVGLRQYQFRLLPEFDG